MRKGNIKKAYGLYDEREEFGIIDEPESLSEIQLAKTYGMSWAYIGGTLTDLLV
jgi:hypothetical protein